MRLATGATFRVKTGKAEEKNWYSEIRGVHSWIPFSGKQLLSVSLPQQYNIWTPYEETSRSKLFTIVCSVQPQWPAANSHLADKCRSSSFTMSTGTSNTNALFDHSPQHGLPGTKNAFCSSLPLPYSITHLMDPCLQEIGGFVSSQSFPINTFTLGSLQKFLEVPLTLQIRGKNMHCVPGWINSAPQQEALSQPSAPPALLVLWTRCT